MELINSELIHRGVFVQHLSGCVINFFHSTNPLLEDRSPFGSGSCGFTISIALRQYLSLCILLFRVICVSTNASVNDNALSDE